MIRKFTIKGLVQGIGYRPFVARLADELNIRGWVRNTGGIVTVLACGKESDLEAFLRRLSCDVPTGGFVTAVEVEDLVLEKADVVNEQEKITSENKPDDLPDSLFRLIICFTASAK